MNGLLHSDEKDPRKKFFHHESVSIPIDVPTRPGFVNQYNIPFGPPVIHAEPEKTLGEVERMRKQLQEQQNHNGFFFNIGGRSIVPEGFTFEEEEEETEKMEEEKE